MGLEGAVEGFKDFGGGEPVKCLEGREGVLVCGTWFVSGGVDCV